MRAAGEAGSKKMCVGGALALYGVRHFMIGKDTSFINCSAGTNGGAVFYHATPRQTISTVKISASFENCHTLSLFAPPIEEKEGKEESENDNNECAYTRAGAAVAVFVQAGVESTVESHEADFHSNGDSNDGNIFYIGFADDCE